MIKNKYPDHDSQSKTIKTKRKPYYRSGRFDPTCRCNGSCKYCRDNRLHSSKVRELSLLEQKKLFDKNSNK